MLAYQNMHRKLGQSESSAMLSQEYKDEIERKIHDRVRQLRKKGTLTSKGERMSLAAIGRAADPPVSRVTMSLLVSGKTVSARLRETLERELGQPYWPRARQV